jgi:tRNA-dependent cyclodipeptide synthase
LIIKSDKIFIPISIGNHYYSTKTLSYIRDYVLPICSSSEIVICDKLRIIIYKMRQIGDEDFIKDKVNKEVEQFKRMLNNCGISDCKTTISTFKLTLNSADYDYLLSRIRILVLSDEIINEYVDVLANKLIVRFIDNQLIDKKSLQLQKDYIVEETALSLYMTEVLGANVELYRREEEGLIKYLYNEHSSDLMEILNKPFLNRRFLSLESMIP